MPGSAACAARRSEEVLLDRAVPLLVIGLIFGGGVGFTIAAGGGFTLDGHDHGDPAHHQAGRHHDAHHQDGAGGFDAAGLCAAGASEGDGHGHGAPEAIAAGADAPSVAMTLAPDPVSGWNLHVVPTHFRFAPEHAGLAPAPGEGHAHVHVNGRKIARLYGDWMHIAELPPGEARVEVALYTNDHRLICVGGAATADAATVSVP